MDVFDRLGLELTDEQKGDLLRIAGEAYMVSNGHVGLKELLQLITSLRREYPGLRADLSLPRPPMASI